MKPCNLKFNSTQFQKTVLSCPFQFYVKCYSKILLHITLQACPEKKVKRRRGQSTRESTLDFGKADVTNRVSVNPQKGLMSIVFFKKRRKRSFTYDEVSRTTSLHHVTRSWFPGYSNFTPLVINLNQIKSKQ